MTAAEANKIVNDALHRLGEHFDAVQILATRMEEGNTHAIKRGCGNWYARQGMAHEFINEDLAQENATQIAAKLQPPTDDDAN